MRVKKKIDHLLCWIFSTSINLFIYIGQRFETHNIDLTLNSDYHKKKYANNKNIFNA